MSEFFATVRIVPRDLVTIKASNIVSVKYEDEASNNLIYVKQMDLFDDIMGKERFSESDYTEAEMERLEGILINLTEGDNGEI